MGAGHCTRVRPRPRVLKTGGSHCRRARVDVSVIYTHDGLLGCWLGLCVRTPLAHLSFVPFSWYSCSDRPCVTEHHQAAYHATYTHLPFSAMEDGVLTCRLSHRDSVVSFLRLNGESRICDRVLPRGSRRRHVICLTYLGFEIWEQYFQYSAAIHRGRGPE